MTDRALERPLKFCKQVGCLNRTRNEGGYCDGHKLENTTVQSRRLQNADPINKMYHREPWTSYRIMLLNNNPICQRLHNGMQCTNASTLVHHLLSPRIYPQGFVSPDCTIALCANCHVPDEGTPDWRVGIDFVKTVFSLPNLGVTQHE